MGDIDFAIGVIGSDLDIADRGKIRQWVLQLIDDDIGKILLDDASDTTLLICHYFTSS